MLARSKHSTLFARLSETKKKSYVILTFGCKWKKNPDRILCNPLVKGLYLNVQPLNVMNICQVAKWFYANFLNQ